MNSKIIRINYYNNNEIYNLGKNYALDEYDLLECQRNILKSYSYQKSINLCNENNKDEKINLLSISYNANFSHKYTAEIFNLVTYYRFVNMFEYNYIPIFLTVTLDGCYRDLINGDYSRFNLDEKLKELPKHLKQRALIKYPFSIKNFTQVLQYQFKKFRDRYLHKYPNVRHEYIRVFEPHKNGFPHLHALLYVPNDEKLIKYLKKIFIQCFPAPQNHKTNALKSYQKRNGELNGFQLSIEKSDAYILKYIFKTYNNTKNNNFKISYLHSWYMKNKIRRFTRSNIKTANNNRLPLCIYRRISGYLNEIIGNDIQICDFYYYLSTPNAFLRYNLNKKKGKIFIHLNIPERGKEFILTEKEVNIYSYYIKNNYQVVFNTQTIKRSKYRLIFDKEAQKFYYNLYEDDFITKVA